MGLYSVIWYSLYWKDLCTLASSSSIEFTGDFFSHFHIELSSRLICENSRFSIRHGSGMSSVIRNLARSEDFKAGSSAFFFSVDKMFPFQQPMLSQTLDIHCYSQQIEVSVCFKDWGLARPRIETLLFTAIIQRSPGYFYDHFCSIFCAFLLLLSVEQLSQTFLPNYVRSLAISERFARIESLHGYLESLQTRVDRTLK